jgi:polar amino acid transport system substrate-binding protein
MAVDRTILDALAPKGVLRAGINMANFLLVSGACPDGTPDGLSPDLARRIAAELGVACEFICYDGPGELADAVANDIWDIGNIAVEPARAKTIDFTIPYTQIDANFLVRTDTPFDDNGSVDSPGVSIAVYGRSAYDLWLSENLVSAEIVRCDSIDASHDMFRQGKTDVLASLKPKLREEMGKTDGVRIIDPPFTGIQQAVGIRKGQQPVVDYLNALVAMLIKDGFIASSMATHGVEDSLSIPAALN